MIHIENGLYYELILFQNKFGYAKIAKSRCFGTKASRCKSSLASSKASFLSINEVFNLCDGDPPEEIYREYRYNGEKATVYRAKYHSRKTDLRLECQKRGISTDGNMQELRNKIIATMPYWKEKIADLSSKPLILLDSLTD
jgi:hypothetical protein